MSSGKKFMTVRLAIIFLTNFTTYKVFAEVHKFYPEDLKVNTLSIQVENLDRDQNLEANKEYLSKLSPKDKSFCSLLIIAFIEKKTTTEKFLIINDIILSETGDNQLGWIDALNQKFILSNFIKSKASHQLDGLIIAREFNWDMKTSQADSLIVVQAGKDRSEICRIVIKKKVTILNQ